MPGWVHIYNANIDELNNVLLKIQGLLDVDMSYLPPNSLIVWDASASRWVARRFKAP